MSTHIEVSTAKARGLVLAYLEKVKAMADVEREHNERERVESQKAFGAHIARLDAEIETARSRWFGAGEVAALEAAKRCAPLEWVMVPPSYWGTYIKRQESAELMLAAINANEGSMVHISVEDWTMLNEP